MLSCVIGFKSLRDEARDKDGNGLVGIRLLANGSLSGFRRRDTI